jgi:glycine/D-amino acid oxidase-like deaminating enzyme
VVVAAGFEAGKFLPEKAMDLTSTYAVVSEPVEKSRLWPDEALIWETREPYMYIRTDGNNRIIVGGEDEPFSDPEKRDALLREKTEILERKFSHILPGLHFKTDMAWCGTFSKTRDGLPFIGQWPGKGKISYALGYGGNGLTFSMIAAQIIRNNLQGRKDPREKFFCFERELFAKRGR